MIFNGILDEYLFVSEIVPERKYMFNKDLKTSLTILWNTGSKFDLTIDNIPYEINTNCFVFLTSFHKINEFDFEKLRVIQFNQPFYCIENHDSDVGCKGLLFFGASSVPKIAVEENASAFDLLWKIFEMEIDQHDQYTLEMLKSLLKRFLILCVRVYKKQNFSLKEDSKTIGLIREFNFLVEKHYKQHTTVAAYADMLFKTPKTLSNLFKKHIDKTPLEIINNRRLLEAKRLLNYTHLPIQEIADELSFNDIQSFSNFFKNKQIYHLLNLEILQLI
ncbi:helix-turn-helix domain-containing protein [Flavobacterium oreochromis]|uniref:helix-turn-helix domain-containing protein n=1 Tax=Flavobacterium oreochromis TaxID=2906078 RepID=UPI001CE55E06|nr:helix-turn-helix domain-containing protein [Flavobacterium oreochromis]QYS86200.1 helix-turn-helix domain-containing protein [Flavobacterium oreochromis]